MQSDPEGDKKDAHHATTAKIVNLVRAPSSILRDGIYEEVKEEPWAKVRAARRARLTLRDSEVGTPTGTAPWHFQSSP